MGRGVPEAGRQCYNSPMNSDLSGTTTRTTRPRPRHKMPFLGRTLDRGPTTIGINCLHSFRVSSFEYNGPNSKIIALISWKRIQLQTHQVSKRYFSVLRSFIIYQICTITFHSAATELDSPLQCHPAPVGREAWAELLKYYKY